jgi:hypothetical protein
MRKMLLAFIPMLAIACEEAPVAPSAEQVAATPAHDWMNNPDVGNLKVYRFEDGMAACWTDPTNGLRACHATVPLGGGGEPDCGLQDPSDPGAWQQVLVDDEAFRVITNAIGRVWITIRNTGAAGECFGSELVAEGWGAMLYSDNDTYGAGAHDANTWGFTANGDLLTPGGVAEGYSGHARYRWNYPQQFAPVSEVVDLH